MKSRGKTTCSGRLTQSSPTPASRIKLSAIFAPTADNVSATLCLLGSWFYCQQWNPVLPSLSTFKQNKLKPASRHISVDLLKLLKQFPPTLPAPWCLSLCPVRSPGWPSSPSCSPGLGRASGRPHPSSRPSGSPHWWRSPATSSLLLCPEQPAASSGLDMETVRNRNILLVGFSPFIL